MEVCLPSGSILNEYGHVLLNKYVNNAIGMSRLRHRLPIQSSYALVRPFPDHLGGLASINRLNWPQFYVSSQGQAATDEFDGSINSMPNVINPQNNNVRVIYIDI